MLVATWATAIGTILVAAVAAWVALWSERRINRRVADERKDAQEREQLTEAWSVEVAGASIPVPDVTSTPENPCRSPIVFIINRGRYTITMVDARFSPDGRSIAAHIRTGAPLATAKLPEDLVGIHTGELGQAYVGVLTPGSAMWFVGDAIRTLHSAYPIVRWRDRWGTTWEHKRGNVQQVAEGAPWSW
jgi:hypothetical protein